VVLWLKRRFSLFDKVLVFCQILNDEVLQAAKTQKCELQRISTLADIQHFEKMFQLENQIWIVSFLAAKRF